jgi:hypothetical protein
MKRFFFRKFIQQIQKNMKHIVVFLFLIPFFYFAQSELIVQGEVVNVRKLADVSGEVVTKVKRFDRLTIVETGKEATVNGITDNWYKVKTETGKIGYVFGHFTSLKREGQITQTMTLNDVSWGDCFHLVFDDIDFGGGYYPFGFGNFNDILDDANRDEPIYIGKVFRVTYNNLFTQEYEYCNPDSPMNVVERASIIHIETNQ